MLWYKKSKIKAPYSLVLQNKLRNKKVLPKLLKGSLALARLVLRRGSKNFILKKVRLGKKFTKSSRILYSTRKKRLVRKKLITKFAITNSRKNKTTKLKLKWAPATKLKARSRDKKSKFLRVFFLKRVKNIFIKKKKGSSLSFLLKHGLVTLSKSNLLGKNFQKKSDKEQKRVLDKHKKQKHKNNQQLFDLKVFKSKTYLSLSSRQMAELAKLKRDLHTKDKFSLLGRNTQVLQIQNLTNATLFLTALKNSTNTTFNFKTKEHLLRSVKIKKSTHRKKNSYFRKKSLFLKLKNNYTGSVYPGKKLMLKSFFKSLVNPKRPHYTRSLLPNNGNSLLLVFTWKLKYLKNLLSKNLGSNKNLFQLGSTIQALVVNPDFRFVKTTSTYFVTNDELFHLVGSSILESTVSKPSNKIMLSLTTDKVSLLTSILNRNNYQLLTNTTLSSAKPKNIGNHLRLLHHGGVSDARAVRVADYSTVVNFLNDFSFLKTTKRINVLSRTSWAVTIPGTVISTNSLNRNHISKNTFVANVKGAINNKFNLLFYRKKIPNYKKLLLLSPQRVSVGAISKSKQVIRWPSNIQLFTPLSALNYKSKSVLLEGVKKAKIKKTSIKDLKKKFKSLLSAKKLLKPILRLKSRNLKRYMFRRKFTKISGGLFLFRKLYNISGPTKNPRTSKKKFGPTHYIKDSKSISYNLVRNPQVNMMPECFLYNYSSVITRRLLLRKRKKQPKTLRLQTQKKLIRIRLKKARKHWSIPKQAKSNKRRIKFGLNSFGYLNSRRSKKNITLTSSEPKNQFISQAILLKKNQNKVMPRAKAFSSNQLFFAKQTLLEEKKRVLKLLQSFSFKKTVYKLTKYTKRRLNLILTNFSYSKYQTTKRFKVSKFYSDSSKGNLPITVSLNTISPFTNYSAIDLLNKNFRLHTSYSSDVFVASFMQSPFLAKAFSSNDRSTIKNYTSVLSHLTAKHMGKFKLSNILPAKCFRHRLTRKIYNLTKLQTVQENFTPWYYNTLVRFMEHCSGKKCLFQFYPFVNNDVEHEFYVRYKKWIPRMAYYERRLGHRFFLEEAIHIMHLSFFLKDPKLICSWLKAIILRISFWKTRSIFRFLKYLIHNYYIYTFPDLGLKGLKIKLKGKISAAGNSRKRTILYRVGKTSHSQVSLRVVNEFMTINTFTGVMGFQIWLFY